MAGVSAVKLSELVGDLGVPIHRVALAKIENGDRDVTVQELVAIAVALDVSPMRLIFLNIFRMVQITPELKMDGIAALAWFIGTGDVAPGNPPKIMPFGTPVDEVMYYAVRIAEVDRSLRQVQRKMLRSNNIDDSSEPESSMSTRMKRAVRAQAEASRQQIELLERERDELKRNYMDALGPADA